jgi:hypothetical protein
MKFINENALPIINAFSNAFSLRKAAALAAYITNLGNIIVKRLHANSSADL